MSHVPLFSSDAEIGPVALTAFWPPRRGNHYDEFRR
jgi:hypothetical protein